MADKLMSSLLSPLVFCCLLLCLHGEDISGYVPLNTGKVGVPMTPNLVPQVDTNSVLEEGEMIETAASDLESEVSLEEWEDENQDGGDTVAFIGGSSPKPTYVDVLLGRVNSHGGLLLPGDIGLTVIPTGFNGTDAKNGNSTDKTRKIMCVGKNITENETAMIRLVNNTGLLSSVGLKNETSSPNCAVVMFYAPWCVFCAKTAPHYNALARAFPQLDIMAIDAIHFSNLNARFGTVAVPNILIFHNGKAVARFNASMRTLDLMVRFVSNVTGLSAVTNVSVEEWDYEGPLPSVPTQEPDYLLWLSWAFVLLFTAYIVGKSAIGQGIWASFAAFGHEPTHQHID